MNALSQKCIPNAHFFGAKYATPEFLRKRLQAQQTKDRIELDAFRTLDDLTKPAYLPQHDIRVRFLAGTSIMTK